VGTCSGLFISNDDLTIKVDSGITVGGSNAITVDASTGLNLTVQAGAIVGTVSPPTNNGLIINSGTISSITNKGTIQGNSVGINGNNGTITTITNEGTGTIAGVISAGINNNVLIDSIINQGTISSNVIGISNNNTIGSITNQGTISGVVAGIFSEGTIGTLNNLQGASGLRYEGDLPTNYNIIINSPSDYGKIVFTSVANFTSFGIYSTSILAASTTYASVIDGLTSANFTGPTSGIFTSGSRSYNWLLQNSSANIWDLIVGLCTGCGPSAADTQATLRSSAQKLRNIFNLATILNNFANMNTYDCNLFDAKGMCISAGGRFTSVDNPNSNVTSAVVVVGYKATPNIRIGGFLDQSVNNSTPSGIKVSNKVPLMGLFAVWNQNADGLGYQVKLANAYQDKHIDITREVIGTSEAGRGDTSLNTQSYVGELSYAINYNDKTLLRPYLALRHTTIKQDAYTETGVATPLSYASLKDRSTTALLGLKLNHKLTPKTTLTASLGVEQDLEHSVDAYSATSTGISGLTSENFNDSIKRTRPVASAGAYYAVSKTQRIAGDIYYQQLPFQSSGSTTAYFNYTIGF
jgi:hypothetical protein